MEPVSTDEVFAIFDRSTDDERWLNKADSAEHLALVTYLMKRNEHD